MHTGSGTAGGGGGVGASAEGRRAQGDAGGIAAKADVCGVRKDCHTAAHGAS